MAPVALIYSNNGNVIANGVGNAIFNVLYSINGLTLLSYALIGDYNEGVSMPLDSMFEKLQDYLLSTPGH